MEHNEIEVTIKKYIRRFVPPTAHYPSGGQYQAVTFEVSNSMRQVNHHLATRDVVFLCGLILVSESFNGQVKWMDRGFQITSC